MTLVLPTKSASPDVRFRDLTVQRVSLLRTALIHLFNACGLTVRKSKDLQTTFGVDYTFSWRLYRLLSDDDVLAHCIDIPTASMMQKLFNAVEQRNAPPKLIAALQDAFGAFEMHVAHFAGDRDFFNVMVTQVVGGELEAQAELAHRKAVFEAHRYLLGVEMDLAHVTTMHHPSATQPGLFEAVYLHSVRGMRRLNAQRPLIVTRENYSKGPDGNPIPDATEPLDRQAFERYGINVLPAFCSAPDLSLRAIESPGKIVTEWMSESMGRPSAIDLAQGRIRRAVQVTSRVRSAHGFNEPAKVFIFDMLVHRSMGKLEPKTSRWLYLGDYSAVLAERGPEYFEAAGFRELPCSEQLSYVGSGEGAAYTSESPQHVEMLSFACQRMGWNLDDFDVYRLRIEFPLIHTVVYNVASLAAE